MAQYSVFTHPSAEARDAKPAKGTLVHTGDNLQHAWKVGRENTTPPHDAAYGKYFAVLNGANKVVATDAAQPEES